MDYQKQSQELDARIRSIQKIEPLNCYVRDGIVNIESWRKQNIRPLFIGKEAHGDGDGESTWSITNWLNKYPSDVCRDSPRSWQKTAYTSHGLQNGFMDYDDMPWIRDDSRVAEALRNIAFINIGKYAAETTTPFSRLNKLYTQNKHIIHEQITMYQPNVIVGWGTMGLLESDPDFMTRFASIRSQAIKHNAVNSWISDGKLFISAYHPSYFSISPERYVKSIVETVKNQIDKIDLSLPSL
ncbi:hypothetical protein [Hymenobacter rubidus]|uniref:hypothetical protein n=1 Tax=Hymenobacter rubidus TaxID=1441626 RepID=UPI00191F94C6|nr:hypothetical protein [Hymenobacter rubidus]